MYTLADIPVHPSTGWPLIFNQDQIDWFEIDMVSNSRTQAEQLTFMNTQPEMTTWINNNVNANSMAAMVEAAADLADEAAQAAAQQTLANMLAANNSFTPGNPANWVVEDGPEDTYEYGDDGQESSYDSDNASEGMVGNEDGAVR